MSINDNKNFAFKLAAREVTEVKNFLNDLLYDSTSFRHQFKHIDKELKEAYAQIDNALKYANGSERDQLLTFQRELEKIVTEVNNID